MKRKKRYTSEEKAIILRKHLEENTPVSDLAEEFGVHPNAIYQWKKKMFESAPESFSTSKKKQGRKLSAMEKRIMELEATLAVRETVIAELAAENIKLKKNIPGAGFPVNGLNLKQGKK